MKFYFQIPGHKVDVSTFLAKEEKTTTIGKNPLDDPCTESILEIVRTFILIS